MRTLRVAAVQLRSVNGDIPANLARARGFVEQAVRAGAQLVLFPEFMATGYAWTEKIWDSAEPKIGPTAAWLAEMSRRHGIWLGTTFLEADGDDFFNTFVLTAPDGSEAGRVRKQHPALWEAFFTRGSAGPHVIDTSLVRIGVGICYENYLAFLPRLMQQHSVDLLLMPHSAPSLAESFPVVKDTVARFLKDLLDVAAYSARVLGIPAVMANKCGPWDSGLSFEKPSDFPGCSAIVDSDGTVKAQLQDEEQVIIADVTLDPRRKCVSPPPAFGRWARKTSSWQTFACWLPETIGALWYRMSARRKKRARAVSSAGAMSGRAVR
ncbi:MAG TPA: carbon-nitrogen hydrolase family protein [Planctomycetaceae bacterium]|nr:carbon-nitrogen hydrolase family protein [Planctomycetaceae bacterium]